MIDWRAVAVISLLGLLLVGYMARSGHARYAPDLVGVAAAFYMQRPYLAMIAFALLAIVRHSRWIAGHLSSELPDWLGRVVLPGGYHMSSDEGALVVDVNSSEPPISELEQPVGKNEIPQPVAEKAGESFYFGETAAIARLVDAGLVGLTEGVKIGGKAKSGAKYQKRTKAVQAELDRLSNHYPQQTDEQRQQRAVLKM